PGRVRLLRQIARTWPSSTNPSAPAKENDMRASLIAFLSMIVAAAAAPAETVNFDKDEVGKPPAGWTATQTGKGNATWTVEKDDSAPSKSNVLKQSGQATYPVC